MKRKAIIYLHLFTWLFAAFININNFNQLAKPEMLLSYVISLLFLAIGFYLFYFFIVPAFLLKKKFTDFFILAALAVLILPFFGYTALLLNKAIFNRSFENFYDVYSLRMHLSGTVAMIFSASFGSFFRVIINWFDALNHKEMLEKQNLESELALLKSKVNPHFLFNTINNIDVLIYQDPDKASNALLKLSEIMRYMSYETVSEYIDLSKEINYIENLVELYRLRIKNPQLIKLDMEGDTSNLKIAPAIFIPFIENAFKYSTFQGPNSGFTIRFKTIGNWVHFVITNYFEEKTVVQKSQQGGTGIMNVKRRLAIIYPDRHLLKITESQSQFMV
ncbi:MAG: histidine kinase, partial [Bacteroidota bacterium]|nr:histidine kinase [Bacteroidota bacterium]